MKQFTYVLVTLGLVAWILLASVADVNYGYGPGYTPPGYGYDSGYGDDYDDEED